MQRERRQHEPNEIAKTESPTCQLWNRALDGLIVALMIALVLVLSLPMSQVLFHEDAPKPTPRYSTPVFPKSAPNHQEAPRSMLA